jgi:hypothetical protein
MYPEARRRVVRMLGELEASSQTLRYFLAPWASQQRLSDEVVA